MRSAAATLREKHWSLVFVAYSFLHLHCLPASARHKVCAPIQSIGQVITLLAHATSVRQQSQQLIAASSRTRLGSVDYAGSWLIVQRSRRATGLLTFIRETSHLFGYLNPFHSDHNIRESNIIWDISQPKRVISRKIASDGRLEDREGRQYESIPTRVQARAWKLSPEGEIDSRTIEESRTGSTTQRMMDKFRRVIREAVTQDKPVD